MFGHPVPPQQARLTLRGITSLSAKAWSNPCPDASAATPNATLPSVEMKPRRDESAARLSVKRFIMLPRVDSFLAIGWRLLR